MNSLSFKPTSPLKTLIKDAQKYFHNIILNISKEPFPSLSTIERIRWILYNGKKWAFICETYTIKYYVQQLRASEVETANELDCFLLEDICCKKPLKLVELNGLQYLPLHSYGKSSTVLY